MTTKINAGMNMKYWAPNEYASIGIVIIDIADSWLSFWSMERRKEEKKALDRSTWLIFAPNLSYLATRETAIGTVFILRPPIKYSSGVWAPLLKKPNQTPIAADTSSMAENTA